MMLPRTPNRNLFWLWALGWGLWVTALSPQPRALNALIDGMEPAFADESDDGSSSDPAPAPAASPGAGFCGGTLAREEIEGIDGAVVGLARTLAAAGYPVSFWTAGPSAAELEAWHDQECDDQDTCEPPASIKTTFDEVDGMIEELGAVAATSQALRQAPIDEVATTWGSWMPIWYDPDDGHDYYDALGVLVSGNGGSIKGLEGWKAEIESVRAQLPTCVPDAEGAITNPPCTGESYSTVDADAFDEFADAQARMQGLIDGISALRTALQQTRNQIVSLSGQLATSFGGLNPATYRWQDSRGAHAVQVDVGPFRLPAVKKKTSGNFLVKKICMVLEHHTSGQNNTPVPKVVIRRRDPTSEMGLWRWNAWMNPNTSSEWTMTKQGCANYSPTAVGLTGCP